MVTDKEREREILTDTHTQREREREREMVTDKERERDGDGLKQNSIYRNTAPFAGEGMSQAALTILQPNPCKKRQRGANLKA